MTNNIETIKTPLTGITKNVIADHELPEVEAWMAQSAGMSRLIASPNVYMADTTNPEAQDALDGIHKVIGGVIHSNRTYEGVGTVGSYDESGRIKGVAFVGSPDSITRRQLEDTRTEVVDQVNGLLKAVQSPYQL